MEKKPLAERLIVVALITALAVVIARSTVLESSREEIHLPADRTSAPHSTGAAAGLTLDLIACIPALLALAARAVQPEEVNQGSVACGLAMMLGAWVAASCCWADDKFAAVVHAGHFCAGLCLLWAVSQCVTTPKRMRLVAAVAFGLLVLNLVQAMQWRFIDLPQTLEYFRAHKDEIIHARGWQPGDFMARQFELKMTNLEMLGFTGSSNSFAAVLVMLGAVSAGLAIQLYRDGAKARAAAVGAVIPVTLWILYFTQSKAAFGTVLLVGVFLALVWKCGGVLRERSAVAYKTGAGIVAAGIVAAIIFSVVFHRLPGASLNFRWRYWAASWQLFKDHALMGVGWSNFGAHYLHDRLPIAAEEIQDPHNFLIRFATETGILGVVLAAAWTARFWWELTQYPQNQPETGDLAGGWTLIAAVGGGLILSGGAIVDFTQSPAYYSLQIFNRLILFLALSAGVWIAAMRADRRPAPWILFCIIIATGVFLIHNLIEFSLFEPGPEMLFALLAGSALGMRRRVAETTPRSAIGWLIGGAVVWLAAILLVIPIVPAEAAADLGDDNLKAENYGVAADHYADAAELVDYNADYVFREAMAEACRPAPDYGKVRSLLAAAISADPSAIRFRLLRAAIELQQRDAAGVRADYDAALVLDPNEVSIRRDYASALLSFGLRNEALEQLKLAKRYNELLPEEEPKRLPVDVLQKDIEGVMSAGSTTKPAG
jgi:O-antigen ligase